VGLSAAAESSDGEAVSVAEVSMVPGGGDSYVRNRVSCLYSYAHTILDMTKTLTIRDEVYRKLTAVKGPDESFSDLFERLVDEESSTTVLRRLRGKFTFSDKRSMLREISALREEKRA